MKADGPRLDGAATSAGMEEGRAGRVLHLCRRRVVGGAVNATCYEIAIPVHRILPVITRVIGITGNYRGITEAARGFTGNRAAIASAGCKVAY